MNNVNQVQNTNQVLNNNQVQNENDSKKIFTTLVLVLTLMICVTSATYAYFAISASSNNVITGNAATASLVITNSVTGTTDAPPLLIAPATATYNSLPMVPQMSYVGTTNVLQKAFDGATGKDKCVDDNGNVICRAYTFVVRNMSSAAVDVRGSVKFSYGDNSTFSNLRWKLMDSETEVTVNTKDAVSTFSATSPVIASTGKVYFDTTNVSLVKEGGTKQYWLIVWIEETGGDQNSTDKGSWYATIAFDAVNESGATIGGVTSTITS